MEAALIVARKSELFSAWFAWVAARRIRGAFESVRVYGLDNLHNALTRGPTLVVTNHTAWWDPLVAVMLSVRVLRADAYAMMAAENLERFPFFGKVGAFGVDRGDPADGARAVRYAAKLLRRGERRLVWIFGQGREVPISVRQLGFQPGSAQIARVARGCSVIPGAIRYEMGRTPRPTLWLSFGPPLDERFEGHGPSLRRGSQERQEARRSHEERVMAELDRINGAVAYGVVDGFAWLLHERREGLLSSMAQSALAWLTRPRKVSR